MSHPTQALDDIVHQRTRLGILAVLAEVGRAQFGFLKEALSLSDGNLSGTSWSWKKLATSRSTRVTRANGPGPGCA